MTGSHAQGTSQLREGRDLILVEEVARLPAERRARIQSSGLLTGWSAELVDCHCSALC
jgi:hypothetical protein